MKRLIPLFLCLALAVLLLAQPWEAGAAVNDALRLCAGTVIPSLFPFLVVTALLLRLGLDRVLRPLCAPIMQPLFHLRGECAVPLLSGMLGGYPAGARAAAQLYEQGALTRWEAERLLGFCNNCSPGFLIAFMGVGVFGSTQVGAYLVVIHISSALLSGMLLCRIGENRDFPALPCRLPVQQMSFPRALTASISDGLTSILNICAYVVFFRTASALLGPAIPAPLLGVLEMVGGAAALPCNAGGFVAAAGLAAWGGVSVHCQTMAVAGELSLRWHTTGKLLQTVVAAALAVSALPFISI